VVSRSFVVKTLTRVPPAHAWSGSTRTEPGIAASTGVPHAAAMSVALWRPRTKVCRSSGLPEEATGKVTNGGSTGRSSATVRTLAPAVPWGTARTVATPAAASAVSRPRLTERVALTRVRIAANLLGSGRIVG